MPNGGSIPGETALNARVRSFTASLVTTNGNYLAATALRDYKAARFGNIYFAGSVVHPSFDWQEMIDRRRVKRFHNARGGEDWVVAWLPKSLEYFTDLGGGGFDGFEQIAQDTAELTQSKRYALGGHSGAIGEGHWDEIAKFITAGTKPFATIEQDSDLFARAPDPGVAKFGQWRIGVPLAFSVTAMAVLLAVTLCALFAGKWFSWGAVGPLGGWGYALWLAALVLFLGLQYGSKKAPAGLLAKALWSLLIILGGGVSNFFFTSLYGEFHDLPTATSAIWATATLIGFAALIGFVLARV